MRPIKAPCGTCLALWVNTEQNDGGWTSTLPLYFTFNPSSTAENCSSAAWRSSTISWASASGSGRSLESSRLLSLSQKMCRFACHPKGGTGGTLGWEMQAPSERAMALPPA